MIFVTSDLNGYAPEAFQKLLAKAGFGPEDELYVLGDVIDRHGDGGISLLRWMMGESNITLLMGNHEAMLLACDFLFTVIEQDTVESITYEQMNALAHWMRNGAEPTMASLRALHERQPEQFYDLMDYLREAPLFEALTVGERDFILTHAGLGGFSPQRKLWQYTADELLWHRPAPGERYFGDVTVVFGHTPTDYVEGGQEGRMLSTDTWIDVDTGAAGNGSPMILRLDDLTPFYADGE
jgi:serine/threonine protein phosphatase 1